MREAERQFRAWHSKQVEPKKEELQSLRAELKRAQKAARFPGAQSEPNEILDLEKRIEILADETSRIPAVTWREQNINKTNLIDMLRRNACGKLTYVDEAGARLVASFCHPSRLAADFSLVTLTNDSADSALIRATGTGGTNILTLADERGVTFGYFCRPHPKIINDLCARISDSKAGSVILGSALVIGGPPGDHLEQSKLGPLLARVMKEVYSRGCDPDDKKIRVKLQNAQLEQEWADFHHWTLQDYLEREPKSPDFSAAEKMPANLQTIGRFASQAALTFAVLNQLSRSAESSLTEVVLGSQHLALAKRLARCLVLQHVKDDWLAARRVNAALARATLLSPEKLDRALQALEEAIEAKGPISRRDAQRIPDVTLGLIDKLVEHARIVEVSAVHAGRRSRSYVLPQDAELDLDEVMGELGNARELFETEKDAFAPDTSELYVHRLELSKRAEQMKRKEFLPCVPVSQMNLKQIRALPWLLDAFPESLMLRGDESDPEPDHLIEEDSPLKPGIPNLWFRYQPDGTTPFMRWKIATRLKAPESWLEDPE